jgi:hypothetical protein
MSPYHLLGYGLGLRVALARLTPASPSRKPSSARPVRGTPPSESAEHPPSPLVFPGLTPI